MYFDDAAARGTDGVKKMSKSLGNTIDLTDSADDMFGKILSISDTLMWRYFDLLSFKPTSDITQYKAAVESGENPKHFKVLLAMEIVARFHGDVEAEGAKQRFENRFSKGQLPEDIPEVVIQTEDSCLGFCYQASEFGCEYIGRYALDQTKVLCALISSALKVI